MSRIASAQIPMSALTDLSRAQRELVEASRQSSAQTKADDVKGYGREAQSLVSAQRLNARAQGFLATGQELTTRMQIQDVALGRAGEIVSSLRQALFQNVGLERGDGVRATLEEAFSVLKDSMNTSLGGRYLFGGALNDQAPVTSASLADLAANPLTAAIEQTSSLQFVRVEEERTLQTGVLARDVISDAMASLKRLAELDTGPDGPFGGPLTPVQKAGIQAELANLDAAFDKILLAQSENGRLLKQVESSGSRQQHRVEALNSAIEGIVGVDLAEVAVRLNQAQYAYQASASVFNTLRDMSLLNFPALKRAHWLASAGLVRESRRMSPVDFPDPPNKPADYECCKRGCCPCIFDYYWDALNRWEVAVRDLGGEPEEILAEKARAAG